MNITSSRYSPLKPEAAPPPPQAGAAPVKKLNLAGFNKKKESSAGAGYPILPDPNGKAAETAAAIRSMTEQLEALDGALKTHKKFLIELASPFHFSNCSGKAEPAKAVLVETGVRKENGSIEMLGTRVRIDFKNSYPVLDNESALVPILGETLGAHFRQKFSLEIDGDKLPMDRAEELLGKLQELFAEYRASDALTVKSGFSPNDDFHVRRHSVLTPEQNLALQKVCPIRAAVATKNVK